LFQKGIIHIRGADIEQIVDRVKQVMFLPQEPYVTAGSLADQIAYPLEAVDSNLSGKFYLPLFLLKNNK